MTTTDTYVAAVTAADKVTIARWRTATCPECEDYQQQTEGTDAQGHVFVDGAVVVGCQGYWVVSPTAVGVTDVKWSDWTDDTEQDECEVHGAVNVMEWGSYSGFAGGSCSWCELSCGCTAVDESADLRAAR